MSTSKHHRGDSSRRLDALRVYLILEGASSLFIQLAVTVYIVYFATTAGLDPLQIMLAASVFEATNFLFEIPTGVVADVYSRKLSIIAGFALLGIGLALMGLFPTFGAILLAEVITGVGATFTSGAIEAWITDEIGVERASTAFVRAAQVRTLGGMAGIVLSVALASLHLGLPVFLSGALLVGLAVFLVIVMPETGFRRKPQSERSTWTALFGTFRAGLRLIGLRRVLIPILLIQFVFAAHSEGIDQLWQPHLLAGFALPDLDMLKPVVWFGIISMGASLLSLGINQFVRRRVDLTNHTATARALLAVYGVMSIGVITFALAGDFAVAVTAYWLLMAARWVAEPVSKAWLNQSLEPDIRATMFSMSSQTGAIGEIVGGPPIGAIATAFSLRAALVASGAILSLTLPFFVYALHGEPEQAFAEE